MARERIDELRRLVETVVDDHESRLDWLHHDELYGFQWNFPITEINALNKYSE